MGLVAGRHLEAGRLDLNEIARLEEAAQRRLQPVATEEIGPGPSWMRGFPPRRRVIQHGASLAAVIVLRETL